MRPLLLGWNANGTPVTLPEKIRRTTHMHVIGGSGTGKSKFLEWIIRRDLHEGQGLCVLDWHGTLYKNVLEWCAYHDVGLLSDSRKVILLNLSEPDFITGFNPFMNMGADIGPLVNRRITATVKPWGAQNTNEMPTFERVCRLVYTFAVEAREGVAARRSPGLRTGGVINTPSRSTWLSSVPCAKELRATARSEVAKTITKRMTLFIGTSPSGSVAAEPYCPERTTGRHKVNGT